MKISFSPVRRDDRLALSVAGDVLTINGEDFDFSGVGEGDTLPVSAIVSDWFAGPVERVSGELQMTLVLPHGNNAPAKTLYPDPITATDGPVSVPAWEEVA